MESTWPQGPWKSGGVLRPRLTRAPQASVRAGGTGESEQPLTKAVAGAGKNRGFSPVALGVCISKGRQTAVRHSERGGGDYPWAQSAPCGPRSLRKSVPGHLPALPALLIQM